MVTSKEVLAYRKHQNLHLAAIELGIPWQTLYVRLKRSGEPVTGNKMRYGNDRDQLGALAEAEFKKLVSFAIDKNSLEYQSKFDFSVLGFKVDVKASRPRQLSKKYTALSWSFSFKRQTLICDFVCCFCMTKDKEVARILLVPSEYFKGLQTVSVGCSGDSKWLDFAISAQDLPTFFRQYAGAIS